MADLKIFMSEEFRSQIEASNLPVPKRFASVEEERVERKKRLAVAFRLFALHGFDVGVAGHITVRDPEFPDHFWVNPLGQHFGTIKASDLQCIDHTGKHVVGNRVVNQAAFCIHSEIHKRNPDIIAAAHSHSFYGRTFSASAQLLQPISQDACEFYNDHSILDDYTGVVLDPEEGKKISDALGNNKAIILKNHGLITVGSSVDAAVSSYINMEGCCHSQIIAQKADKMELIPDDVAQTTYQVVGGEYARWLNFQPLYERIIQLQPDVLE